MPLQPFVSYFGSKKRLATAYPYPIFDMIIEPFAGAAGYSLLYPEKQVRLYDIYEPIVEVWDYIIHASQTEIMSLPLGPFTKNNPITSHPIPKPAQYLIGFWLTESQTSASRYPLSKSRGGNWTARRRFVIANQLEYVRHWKVEKRSYAEIDNETATWFVDPPYQKAGGRYVCNRINYEHLALWSQSREGQVIVCEQGSADWLPFKPLRSARNSSNKDYKEVVWYNKKFKYGIDNLALRMI